MKSAFIFHGTAGHPKENWFPWLKGKLELLGYTVIVPQFPTLAHQTLENWFNVFEKYKEFYSEDTVLIGHSLGGSFLLRVLEKYDIKIKAAFIVAAPIGVLPIKNYEGDKPFIGHALDWKKIKSHSNRFFIFHSDNDPYVDFGNGKELSKNLGTELIFIPDAGHFNEKAGYLQFDLLLDKIKEL
ncbi:MAG: hypothetical protein EPN86_05960 [Nanoarchaeota archaeon]|nr:MAG: hypothetical protein EPN86_05960 [Nanoarchaeota archaeon]